MSRITAGVLLLALVALAWWGLGDDAPDGDAAVVSLADGAARDAGGLPTLATDEAPADIVPPGVDAPADTDAARDASPAVPPARLRGRVVWRDGGPVADAALAFDRPTEPVGLHRVRSPEHLAEATTDDDGRFDVELPPGDAVDVVVETDALASWVRRRVQLTDAAGGTAPDAVEVVLDPPCELVVHGLDDYARAHPDAVFGVAAPSSEVATARIPLSEWTGRVMGLSRGSVVICVLRTRDGTPTVLAADVALHDVTQELRVTLPDALTAPTAESWRLRWRVVTPEGKPVGVETFFESGLDPMSAGLPATFTDGAGRTEEFPLRCQDVTLWGDTDVSLEPPLDVALRMGGLTATARVESTTDEATFVLDGVLDADATTRVFLEPSEMPRPPLLVSDAARARLFMAVAKRDGTVSFLAAPGRYAVSATSATGGRAVASVEVRGEPELHVPLVFEAGAHGSGRLDPPPAPGESVTLDFHHRTLDGLTPVNPTAVRPDGTFDVRPCAPGAYAVAVQRRADGVTAVTLEDVELRPGKQELLLVTRRHAEPRRVSIRLEGALQGYVSLEDRATGRRAQLILTQASTDELLLPPGDWTYLAVLKTGRNGHTTTSTGPLPDELVLSP